MTIYRNALSGDAVRLAALSIEVWLNTYAKSGISNIFADYVLQRFTSENFQSIIADAERQVILCEEDDRLLGYIALDYKPTLPDSLTTRTGSAEITTLYVRSRHAGRGIGKALMQQARNAASARNLGHIWLSVLHDNQRALNFYQQQGMERQGSVWFELSGERHENFVLIQPV